MQQYGGVLSEFPLNAPSMPYHFSMRNRIISGLSDGILVIEAKKGSGSLITPKLRQASHCIGCNQCVAHCPQNIDIPKELHRIDQFVEQLKQGTL